MTRANSTSYRHLVQLLEEVPRGESAQPRG